MTQAFNLSQFANKLNSSGQTDNTGLQNSSVTVTAGTGLSGGGAIALGGSTTLNNTGVTSIVAGTGAGQQRTISSYAAATRVVTVSSAWSTTPDTTSVYSIGRLTTTRSGDVVGIFNIPASIFRVGEKQFRLIDNSTGDILSSSTNGDASFYAQGLLETTENTIVSTIQPTVQRTSVKDSKVTTTTSTITTPLQLRDKWATLESSIIKHQSEKKNKEGKYKVAFTS